MLCTPTRGGYKRDRFSNCIMLAIFSSPYLRTYREITCGILFWIYFNTDSFITRIGWKQQILCNSHLWVSWQASVALIWHLPATRLRVYLSPCPVTSINNDKPFTNHTTSDSIYCHVFGWNVLSVQCSNASTFRKWLHRRKWVGQFPARIRGQRQCDRLSRGRWPIYFNDTLLRSWVKRCSTYIFSVL